MALHPRYADGILSGAKRYEIRRRRPGFAAGSIVWIYATRPTGMIVGAFESGTVHEGRRPSSGKHWGTGLGVTRAELDGYLSGAGIGYAIEVTSARRCPCPSAWIEIHPFPSPTDTLAPMMVGSSASSTGQVGRASSLARSRRLKVRSPSPKDHEQAGRADVPMEVRPGGASRPIPTRRRFVGGVIWLGPVSATKVTRRLFPKSVTLPPAVTALGVSAPGRGSSRSPTHHPRQRRHRSERL